MAPRREKGEVDCDDQPEGWAFAILLKLKEWDAGTEDSLFTDKQEETIRNFAIGDHPYIPDGWCKPDPWRVRSLEKLNNVKGIIPPSELEKIVDQLMLVKTYDEIPHEWKVAPPAALQAVGDQGLELGSNSGSVRKRPTDDADAGAGAGAGEAGTRAKLARVAESQWGTVTGHPDGEFASWRDNATHDSVKEWVGSGDARIGGNLIGPHPTSKGSGSKASQMRFVLQCREHRRPSCGMQWTMTSSNKGPWDLKCRVVDHFWDGEIHFKDKAVKAEEGAPEGERSFEPDEPV